MNPPINPPAANAPVKKKLSPAEAGRLGGKKTAQRYGKTFFETIGKKGGDRLKTQRGTEYYAEIGKKGVRARQGGFQEDEVGLDFEE